MERLLEYKAMPISGQESPTRIYEVRELQIEKITDKINEIIQHLEDEKKYQLL